MQYYMKRNLERRLSKMDQKWIMDQKVDQNILRNTGWQFHNGRYKLIFPISITLKMSL